MGQKTCSNPECKRQYLTSDSDDGFCSFECWEKINCCDPIQVTYEDLPIIEL